MKREQRIIPKTGRTRRFLLIIAIAAIITSTAGYLFYRISRSRPYEPPPFEVNAITGEPTPDANYGYSPVRAEGGLAFGLASNIYRQEDGSLNIFFTNPADSGVWFMFEMYDFELKTVVYKSGVLKAGEYVDSLSPMRDFPNKAAKVEIRVYAFEPETYQSRGTVYLNTTLQPW